MSVAKLVEIEPSSGREVDVTGEVTFGREGVDVIIDDSEASRRHAAVGAAGGVVTIRDLGSRNGTFVNDQQLTGEMRLSDRDTIRIASCVWRVLIPASGGAAPGPAGGSPERGDVPAPEPASASRVGAQPVFVPQAAPAFGDASKDGRRVGSAARRVEAAVVSYAIVAATAVAVVAYLVAR